MSLTPDHLAPVGYPGGDCGLDIVGLLYDLHERLKKVEEILLNNNNEEANE